MASIIAVFQNCVDLLWSLDCVATSDCLEPTGVVINFLTVGAYLRFARRET